MSETNSEAHMIINCGWLDTDKILQKFKILTPVDLEDQSSETNKENQGLLSLLTL